MEGWNLGSDSAVFGDSETVVIVESIEVLQHVLYELGVFIFKFDLPRFGFLFFVLAYNVGPSNEGGRHLELSLTRRVEVVRPGTDHSTMDLELFLATGNGEVRVVGRYLQPVAQD